MTTHFDITSIAARLDAGTYSACIARRPVAAPTRPVAGLSEPWWPYAAAGLMGAVIGLLLAS